MTTINRKESIFTEVLQDSENPYDERVISLLNAWYNQHKEIFKWTRMSVFGVGDGFTTSRHLSGDTSFGMGLSRYRPAEDEDLPASQADKDVTIHRCGMKKAASGEQVKVFIDNAENLFKHLAMKGFRKTGFMDVYSRMGIVDAGIMYSGKFWHPEDDFFYSIYLDFDTHRKT